MIELGRMGFEVQHTLLVRPEVLDFDPDARKLGTKLVPEKCALDRQLPQGWSWVADPSPGTTYLPDDVEPSPRWADFFLTHHHRYYRDSTGYRTYWVYSECKRVCYQLELVSEPRADWTGFHDEVLGIYRKNLADLLARDIVAAWTPTTQQRIKEQVSVELQWPGSRHDALDLLLWMGVGVWLLTRSDLPRDGAAGLLVDRLDADLRDNARQLLRYDLFTNFALLLDGYFLGVRAELDVRWLRRLLSRPHAAILATAFNNDICYFFPHGFARVTADELRTVSPRDFELYRSLGIDSLWLDLLGGVPQPHLTPWRTRRLDFIRDSLDVFVDLDAIQAFVRATVLREGEPATDTIELPLFHPRKTWTPGHVWLELRHVHPVKFADHPRYPAQFVRLDDARGNELQVVWVPHLANLATDLRDLLGVAAEAGRAFVRAANAGEESIRERDRAAVLERFAPYFETLTGTPKSGAGSAVGSS